MDQYSISGPTPSLESLAIRLTDPLPIGPVDLIPGFIPRGGFVIVAGSTNCGKSLASLEVVSALVTGKPLWGELQPTLQAKRVLYVLGEHSVDVIHRLAVHTGLVFTDDVFVLGPEQLGINKWLAINGQPNLIALEKFKRWAEGVDFIVFDPLSAFLAGDENDSIQMRIVLDQMSLIAQTVKATCLVLAHQGKPFISKDGHEHKRETYAVRGSSAIEDTAMAVFYLSKDDSSPMKDAQIFDLKCRKYKGNVPDSYRLLRDPSNLTHTLLGNKPFVSVQKIATQGDIARILAYQPDLGYREAVRLVAAVRGVSEATIKRHLGLSE